MSRELFEQVTDVLGGLVTDEHADFEHFAHGSGVKVWYDRPKEHYEAQFVRSPDHDGAVLEVGFHAEHPNEARNVALIEALTTRSGWRRALGRDAEAGAFLGGRDRPWRRLSEVWDEIDVAAEDLALEIADRLSAYIEFVEPRLR